MSGQYKIVEWPETSSGSLDAIRFYLTPDNSKRQFVAFCPSRPFILDSNDPRCTSRDLETIQDFSKEAGWIQVQEKPKFRIFKFDQKQETIEEVCVLNEKDLSLKEISREYDLPIIQQITLPKGY